MQAKQLPAHNHARAEGSNPDAQVPECQRSEHGALRQALQGGRTAAIAAASKLRGAFAVAVQDADARRAMLAVDRFARSTLCFRVDGDRIQTATRADELAPRGTRIDSQAIVDYLYFHCIPAPRTVFEGVYRVPAGHAVWFEDGRAEYVRLWQPALGEPVGSTSFSEKKDSFLRLLESAVVRNLDTTTPACFLSGGTDSSTVAGMVRRATGKPVESYSIGFDAEGYDEMEYARLAARHFGTHHHEYYVTPADLVSGMPKAAAHHDQPFGNSSALPAYYCAMGARQDGISRLLAGDGGDELFGGNARYAKQTMFGWYDQVPGALRRAVLEPFSDTALAQKLPLVRKGASYVAQARVPMPDRMQSYNLLKRLGGADIFAQEFLATVDLGAPLAHERSVWAGLAGASPLNRMLAFDWRYTLAENDLVKVRSSTELAGVTAAYPLLDDELADFSLTLTANDKLRRLKLRWFFKEALRGFLPDEIITKKKHGFGLPFGTWMCKDEGLQRLASDCLASFEQRGVLKPGFTAALLKTHLPAHPGFYGEMVWLIVMLELWLQVHAPDWRPGC